MNFFDRIFLDNTVQSYCIVAGSILLVVFLRRYLSRYIAALVFRIVHRIWKDIKKKDFVDLVVQPLGWFLVVLVTVFAIDKLNFPGDWRYTLYGHSTEEIINKLGMGIIIVNFTWLILRFIDFIALVLEQRATLTIEKSDEQLIVFFRDFLKVIVGILGLLLLIKACFNQPIGNLLTSLSIVGAVVALAAKESLENLIASFIIFFDKPFATGDTLKVNAVTGTVERIGLRSTRIRTADKTLVTVPNKQMVDSVVDNWSMRTHRRGEMKLELSPATPSVKVKETFDAISGFINGKADSFTSSSVFVTDITKTGVTITVEFFTQPVTLDQFNHIRQDMVISLKKMMEDLQVEMAATGNTVTIINESKE
jgi:MscS family membrane protein